MAWDKESRSRIPERVKSQVRRRDKTCRLNYQGCTHQIDEFDHIQGLAALGIPRTPVLNAEDIQGVCKPCHAIKSEAQRVAGYKAFRAKHYREPEPHPGTLP